MGLSTVRTIAFISIACSFGAAAEPPRTFDGEFAGDFGTPVGAPGRLAEVALISRDYVCVTNGIRTLVGYKTSLVGWYQWTIAFRGFTVSVQEEESHFRVKWPNGRVIRFTADYSKAGAFVDERCKDLKLRPAQPLGVREP